MNKLKPLFILALLAFAFGVTSVAQINPPFGPVNGGPQNNPYLPAANTPAYISYISAANAPALNSVCYSPIIVLLDTQTQNMWICAQAPNTQRTSLGTWVILEGTYGLARGFTALASAATIAPTSTIVNLTGTTPATTITAPAGLLAGAVITFITNSATTNAFPTGNNITGTGTGITTAAGQALVFVYDGTNFHYRS